MDCRTCRHWHDGNLLAEEKENLSYGCRILGEGVLRDDAENCEHYAACEDSFLPCRTCGTPVPRVCLLFGECVNCTDSDWKCLEACGGGRWQAFCTHWNRLKLEGKAVAVDGKAYAVFAGRDGQPPPPGPETGIKSLYEAHLRRRREAARKRPGRR